MAIRAVKSNERLSGVGPITFLGLQRSEAAGDYSDLEGRIKAIEMRIRRTAPTHVMDSTIFAERIAELEKRLQEQRRNQVVPERETMAESLSNLGASLDALQVKVDLSLKWSQELSARLLVLELPLWVRVWEKIKRIVNR